MSKHAFDPTCPARGIRYCVLSTSVKCWAAAQQICICPLRMTQLIIALVLNRPAISRDKHAGLFWTEHAFFCLCLSSELWDAGQSLRVAEFLIRLSLILKLSRKHVDGDKSTFNVVGCPKPISHCLPVGTGLYFCQGFEGNIYVLYFKVSCLFHQHILCPICQIQQLGKQSLAAN